MVRGLWVCRDCPRSARLQTCLLQTPEQHIQAILTKEGFALECASWHTPMACLVVICLVLLDDGVKPAGLGKRFRIQRRQVQAGSCSSLRQMITLIPGGCSTPDQGGYFIRKLNAFTCLGNQDPKTGEPMDVGLIFCCLRPAILARYLNDGIRVGPGKRQFQKLGYAKHIDSKIGKELRLNLLKELRRAYRNRIHRSKVHLQLIVVLPLA